MKCYICNIELGNDIDTIPNMIKSGKIDEHSDYMPISLIGRPYEDFILCWPCVHMLESKICENAPCLDDRCYKCIHRNIKLLRFMVFE